MACARVLRAASFPLEATLVAAASRELPFTLAKASPEALRVHEWEAQWTGLGEWSGRVLVQLAGDAELGMLYHRAHGRKFMMCGVELVLEVQSKVFGTAELTQMTPPPPLTGQPDLGRRGVVRQRSQSPTGGAAAS